MDSILRHVRLTLRVLSTSPAFTLSAVVCLGLGIGANTALFSIFNALLWKPLPVREPQTLVRVFAKGPEQTRLYLGFSFPEYEDYRRGNDALAALAATRPVQAGFRTAGGGAERVFGEAVSDNYFEMLGIRAHDGRLLGPGADGTPNLAPDVVVSHRFWTRRLHADPDVVGTTVWLTGAAYTIVGIAPPGFNGTYPLSILAPDLWVPLATLPLLDAGGEAAFRDRAHRSLNLLGRLAPETPVARAQAAFDTIAARLASSYPESNKGVRVRVFEERHTRPEVYSSRAVNLIAVLFLGLAVLVLLVACANVANLMLARASARRREIGVRMALGASRTQLVQQLVAEAVAISLAAGAAGLAVAWAIARAVSSVRLPGDLPIVFDVTLDVRVLGFTLAVSLGAGLAFGVLPAVSASHTDIVHSLKSGRAAAPARRRRFAPAGALVIAQVAMSLVVLVSAGLFWRSIAGTAAVDPGLQLADRVVVSFSPALVRYDAERTATFYRTLVDRVRQQPQVENAALAAWVPLGLAFQETSVVVRGAELRDGRTTTLLNVVGSGYFATAGVPLKAGRDFTDRDTAGTEPVTIVNETFARLAWPGLDPVGRQLRSGRDEAPWLTVVGVVADGKYRTLTEPAQPCVFRPALQAPRDALTLVVHTRAGGGGRAGPAEALAAIRQEVQALDPDMPLLDVKTMEQQMAKVRFLPRAMTMLAAPAAAIAILIAIVGLYGVIAYSVGRRTPEFGVRLAVGARPRDVVGQVMGQGWWITGAGLGVGLIAALLVARLMRGLLVGVSWTEPAVFFGAFGLLALVATAATWVPARRASRVDPLRALREE